jgi:GDP-L-fucose synthase
VKSPATMIYDNLMAECHVIESARKYGATKLLYFASSCCYPRQCEQPMRVESLMTGSLEPTNEPYAVAKIAGIKLCQSYRRQHGVNCISGIPGDQFGPHDDFSVENSHVIGALIRKVHEAKETGAEFVEVWGTGKPRREFIFADDLANASIFVMMNYDSVEPINIGSGWDYSIGEVAAVIKDVIGYKGALRFNTERPDGMPAKLLDSTVLKTLGWRPRTTMKDALLATYQWYLTHYAAIVTK